MRLIIDADAGVDWSPGIKQQHVRLTARDAVDFLNPQAHVLHTHDGHASQNNSQQLFHCHQTGQHALAGTYS